MTNKKSTGFLTSGYGVLGLLATLALTGCNKEGAADASPKPGDGGAKIDDTKPTKPPPDPSHPVMELRQQRATAPAFTPTDLRLAETKTTALQQPKVHNAKTDGPLVLDAAFTELMLDDGAGGEQPARLRTYNGNITGPTLYVDPRKGDVEVEVKLCNKLGATSCTKLGKEGSHQHGHGNPNNPANFQADWTNLHTHGLHVSPSEKSDNVFILLEPGEYFDYSYTVAKTHPPGTHWYHAHHHGSTAVQLGNGMAGALIVAGGLDDAPGIKGRTDHLFVFQQIPWDSCQATNPGQPYKRNSQTNKYECDGTAGIAQVEWNQVTEAWSSYYTRHTLVNGLTKPEFSMQPGEVQRWRFLHAGILENLNLRLCAEDQFEACLNDKANAVPQHRIAIDGIATGKIQEIRDVYMGPGYRTDVLVRAPACDKGKTCTYFLIDTQSTPSQSLLGKNEQGQVVAVLSVTGAPLNQQLPTDLSAYEAPYTVDTITDQQEVIYAPDKATCDARCQTADPTSSWCTCKANYEACAADPNNEDACLGQLYNVNGRPFTDDDGAIRELTLDTSSKWTVTSASWGPHPFHIHVNPFKLVKVTCTDSSADPLVNFDNDRDLWRDTLLIAKGCTYELETKYTNFTGKFVQHCHILNHEDQGMMEIVEIVRKPQ